MQFVPLPSVQPHWATTIRWSGVDLLVDRFGFVIGLDPAVLSLASIRRTAASLTAISPVPIRLISVDSTGSATFQLLQLADLRALLDGIVGWLAQLVPARAIRYIAPVQVHKALASPVSAPFFSDWPYAKIRAAEAWAIERGENPGIGIGIIDSGIALASSGAVNHPDLNPARFHLGGNYVRRGAWPADDNDHGTMVAGIAANGNNDGRGIPGMTAATQVHICKTLNAEGQGTDAAFKQAVKEIVSRAVKAGRKVIINYSAGGPAPSRELESACRLIEKHGMLLIASAGDNSGTQMFPAGYSADIPNVVSVSGVDEHDRLFGPIHADVFGPAVNVRSTVPPGTAVYRSSSGTSLATPFVSGLAALVWSANPEFSAAEVKARIVQRARIAFGRPVIDAAAALA